MNKLGASIVHSSRISFWLVFLLYVLLNTFLLIIVEPSLHLTEGADADSWYSPALALLEYGSFVTLSSPETLMTYRPPLYPLFEAITLWVGGGEIIPIIIAQVILLWVTGVIAGRIVRLYLPRYEIISIVLFVFNPNALGSAHLIQSDTLYVFFIVLAMWALVQYINTSNKLKWSIIIGIILGISCLVRPTGQYLIILLPVIFFIINIFSGNKEIFFNSMLHGVIGVVLSVIMIFPWVLHNEEAGWGYVLVTSEPKTFYLRDNAIYLEKNQHGISIEQATDIILNDEKNYIITNDHWFYMSDKEKADELVIYYMKKLISYPIAVIFESYLDSWIGFFGGGGGANFQNLLSLDGKRSFEESMRNNYSGRLEVALKIFTESSLVAILISVYSYFYVILLRILGLIGIIEIYKRKEYSLLVIVVGLILYFAITVLFVGTSRYRLPTEIGLIMLALYGILFFYNKMQIKNKLKIRK